MMTRLIQGMMFAASAAVVFAPPVDAQIRSRGERRTKPLPVIESLAGSGMATINEIHADPDATNGDANGDGTVNTTQDEFVEIVNTSGGTLDMSNWTLSDAVSVRHTFPAGTSVDNGCAIVVFAGGTPTGDFGGAVVQVASGGQLGLNNGGDTITLADAGAIQADQVVYGSEGGDNQSLTLDPDVTGAFVKHGVATGSGGTLFSPGTRIDGTPHCSATVELIINELDADQVGTDAAEFVEIYDGGVGNTSLDGHVLVFYNGSTDLSYAAFDLDGFSTGTTGYFVLCGDGANVANCNMDVTPNTNLIQNGEDAVALILGNGTDYPTGTAIPGDLSVVVDAIVYDTSDPDDPGLLVLLNAGQPQVDENGGGDGPGHSNQRCPNGSGGQRNTDTYIQNTPTPGAENLCLVTPTGGCCDDLTFNCTVETEADCTTLGFRYGGDGSDCTTIDPPCSPTGACCEDNTFVCLGTQTQAACEAVAGQTFFVGEDCLTFTCPIPTGACCDTNTFTCTDTVELSACSAAGQTWSQDTLCADLDPACPLGPPADAECLIITEVLDGTETGGLPKFVEITNTGATDYTFTQGGIIIQSNAATDLDIDQDLTGVTILAGDSFVIADSAFDGVSGGPAFESVYGFPADIVGSAFSNGDDRYILTNTADSSNLVDIHGEIDVDGTGAAWEYTDSYAFRNSNVNTGNGGVFDITEWTHGGVDALDGVGPAGIDAVTDPGEHTYDSTCGEFCGNGIVEGAEQCDDPASPCCNSDCTFATAGTECRAAAGACDIAEACDGASATCPPDLFDTMTVCRPAAGACDIAETCSGSGPDCPADVLQDASFECREADGACDVAEFCDGATADCPADAVLDSTNECRAAAGDCDVAEFCDGVNTACPANGFDSGTECRAAAGICDVAESCDGTSADCPADGFDSMTECRASTGVCDPAETCDGTGADCPADVLSTAVCRASAGVCDVAESCDGVNSDCPADAVAGTMTVCRASTGACDPAESCDGTGTACPADTTITDCVSGDGCCLAGCNNNNDSDCPAVCGNSAQESGEECDDGNTADGDGCAADCTSEFVPNVPASSPFGMALLIAALVTGLAIRSRRRSAAA